MEPDRQGSRGGMAKEIPRGRQGSAGVKLYSENQDNCRSIPAASGSSRIGVSHPDSFDELYRNNNARSRSITARLKKMLSDVAVVEFRMCDVGQNGGKGKNGPEVAQKIANHLGCRVKVFTERINPYGGKDIWWFIPAKYDIYNPNLEK